METEIKQMVRMADADILGTVKVFNALRRVKGISFSMANALCKALAINPKSRIGELSDAELEKIEDAMKNPLNYGISEWMLNRRKDYETGEDLHIVGSQLPLNVDFDIKRMKKIKCYKGIRHGAGLPVRGQRTRAHFRHGKTVGVVRSKEAKSGRP